MESNKVSVLKILEHLGAATIEANELQGRCIKYEATLKEAIDTLEWVKRSMKGDYFNVLDKSIEKINEALNGDGEKEVGA